MLALVRGCFHAGPETPRMALPCFRQALTTESLQRADADNAASLAQMPQSFHPAHQEKAQGTYRERVLNVVSVGVALERAVGSEPGLAVLDVQAVGVGHRAVPLRDGCNGSIGNTLSGLAQMFGGWVCRRDKGWNRREH